MLENIIGALVISLVNFLLWIKLLDKNVDYRCYKVYLVIIIMTVTLILNFFLVNPLLKILTILLIVSFVLMYLFNLRYTEAMAISIVNQMIYIISEIIVIIMVLIITNIQNKKELVDLFSGTIYANILISIVVLVMSRLSITKKAYLKLNEFLKNQKIYNVLLIVFILFGIISVFLNFTYYNDNLVLLSISCLALAVFYVYIAIKNVSIRNNYLNMYFKYNNTLEALKSYEDILDKYKVSNHENKNQLLMIRNMIGKDDKKEVSEYIDKIVKNEYEDDENLIMETSKIPSGGLRALIYSKILYMKNNKIEFSLKVDRKIRSIELINLDSSIILDICKIIGVFLDNAIDEIKNNQKGSVSIELYMLDKKLNISISNTFEGFIDLDKIDEMKYTTKGTGHGYGLSLVREIIDKNKKLENLRMVNDNVFTQILKISI